MPPAEPSTRPSSGGQPEATKAGWLAGPGHLQADVAHSLRNTAKLGASLIATWAVALIVRIFLPRHLGPASFGTYQFADSFTATIFVVTTLGIETYVRKEIATNPEHANDFFGGTLLVRLALSVLVLSVAVPALAAAGQPPEALRLVLVLGLAQLLININLTFAAFLQAAGAVGGLSLLNVVVKVVWGLAVVGALSLGGSLLSVGAVVLGAEVLRTGVLAVLVRRHFGLRFRINRRASGAVMLASLPFYLQQLAQTVYARIDVSIMAFVTTSVEVGWYAAATSLTGLAMLLSPLIGWVLLPLSSRAAARSEDELTLVFRRSTELILALAFPVSLFLWVGADVIVSLAFGAAYEPAAASLRVLAPTFLLTYLTIIEASILVRLDRGWALMWISLAGMAIAPPLNYWLIRVGLREFGRGGAGLGAAVATTVTEFLTVAAMTSLLGSRIIDRRGAVMLAKTIGASVAVVVVDRVLAPLGAWRLLADAVVYVALVVVSGAVDIRSWTNALREAMGRRAAPGAA
jgi:O-antigen/teichoic acid export membrane protein